MGVSPETIKKFGAVSEETVKEMAVAARKFFKTNYALATTGVAGSEQLEGKKTGTTWIALAYDGGTKTLFTDWSGDRIMIKKRACRSAFQLLLSKLLKKD